MNFRCFFISFFLIGVSTTLFGQNLSDKVISDSIHYIEGIVAEAPEIIKQHRDGKFYLEENRIYSMGDQGYLLLADEKNIPLHSSLIFADNDGPYFSLSREVITQLVPYPPLGT